MLKVFIDITVQHYKIPKKPLHAKQESGDYLSYWLLHFYIAPEITQNSSFQARFYKTQDEKTDFSFINTSPY